MVCYTGERENPCFSSPRFSWPVNTWLLITYSFNNNSFTTFDYFLKEARIDTKEQVAKKSLWLNKKLALR